MKTTLLSAALLSLILSGCSSTTKEVKSDSTVNATATAKTPVPKLFDTQYKLIDSRTDGNFIYTTETRVNIKEKHVISQVKHSYADKSKNISFYTLRNRIVDITSKSTDANGHLLITLDEETATESFQAVGAPPETLETVRASFPENAFLEGTSLKQTSMISKSLTPNFGSERIVTVIRSETGVCIGSPTSESSEEAGEEACYEL